MHPLVAKLGPEILNSVNANKSSNKKADKLDTADTANADTSHEQPEEPFRLKALVALVVEFGPAKDSRDCTTKQHRVEENESANSGVRVLAKDHESYQPDGRTTQLELTGGKVGHRDTDDSKEGVEGAHESIVDILGIFLAGFEFERSVVAGEHTGQTNQHLAQGRMDVEVVFMFDVVASKLAEAGDLLARSRGQTDYGRLTELHPMLQCC